MIINYKKYINHKFRLKIKLRKKYLMKIKRQEHNSSICNKIKYLYKLNLFEKYNISMFYFI